MLNLLSILISFAVAQSTSVDPHTSRVDNSKTTISNDSISTEHQQGMPLPPKDHKPRVGDIYESERQKVVRRVESLHLTQIAFGPAWAKDMNNTNMFYYFLFGKTWEANTNAEIRLNLDGALASKNTGGWVSTSIGASWLFLTDDISPLVGGEFGLGYAHMAKDPDAAGFMGGIYGGVRFFRTATAQVNVEAYAKEIFNSTKPVLSGVRVSILF